MKVTHYSGVLWAILVTVGAMTGTDLGAWLLKRYPDLPGAEVFGVVGMFVGFAGSVLLYLGCTTAIRRLTTCDLTNVSAADYGDPPPAG